MQFNITARFFLRDIRNSKLYLHTRRQTFDVFKTSYIFWRISQLYESKNELHLKSVCFWYHLIRLQPKQLQL